jgi:phage baseplate assembly protein W
MSTDIQIASLVDQFSVLSQEEVVGAIPRAIRLTGAGSFFSAQRVFINEYGVDDFTIISNTVLLVFPPSLFTSVAVEDMKIEVASGEYTGNQQARLIFGPTKNVRAVTGIQKLVQQIAKTLLTTSGTNKFDVGYGGDLLRELGTNFDPAAGGRISAAVARAVATTEESMIVSQLGERGLPADERLLRLTLDAVVIDTALQEVRATVKLVTYAGNTVGIPLTL